MATKPLVRVVQEAIYQTRWIDAIKDHRMATDEEIAKAIVAAIERDIRLDKVDGRV